MDQTQLWGIGVVTLAGILQGSFAAPMKRMSGWRWENSWLVFSLSGLIVFPWIMNFATVPNVISVYSGASPSTFIKVLVFGLLWGVGSTLFGLGISRVGMGLGFALILGITASFGSLLPLVILHPEQLAQKRGLALIAATFVMAIGLVFLALSRTHSRARFANQRRCTFRFRRGIGPVYFFWDLLFHAELQFCIRR